MSSRIDRAALRTVYREPNRPAREKAIDHLDGHCADFIARSPMAIVATSDENGRCDVSPKGGPPGFVRVLDGHTLAFGDLAGNNRLDSIENLLTNPGIALLFLIPGLDETLRVNGTGYVTTEPSVLERCVLDGRMPRVAWCVDVQEAYIHCAKAFRRGRIWDADAWPDTSDMASVGCMLRDHIGLENVTGEQVTENLEAGYAKTLWEPGAG